MSAPSAKLFRPTHQRYGFVLSASDCCLRQSVCDGRKLPENPVPGDVRKKLCSVQLRGFPVGVNEHFVDLYLEPSGDVVVDVAPPQAFPPESGPFLKSLLQKSVRRNNWHGAVFAAQRLWWINPSDLLRRIFVIAVEDSVATPHLLRVAWLMMAVGAGAYTPGARDRRFVLRLVGLLAQVRYRDTYAFAPAHDAPVAAALLKTTTECSDGGCSDVATALFLRSCYGGTEGDVAMLRQATLWWSERMRKRHWQQLCALLMTASIEDNGITGDDDYDTLVAAGDVDRALLGASADFHCYPNMVGRFVGLPPQHLCEQRIRDIVFTFSSGLSFKTPLGANIDCPTEKQKDTDVLLLIDAKPRWALLTPIHGRPRDATLRPQRPWRTDGPAMEEWATLCLPWKQLALHYADSALNRLHSPPTVTTT
jgi:hypothetical protein